MDMYASFLRAYAGREKQGNKVQDETRCGRALRVCECVCVCEREARVRARAREDEDEGVRVLKMDHH